METDTVRIVGRKVLELDVIGQSVVPSASARLIIRSVNTKWYSIIHTVYNVHVVPEECSIFLEDTHASKVRFSLIEHLLLLNYIYMIVGTIVSQLSVRKIAHKYCVILCKLFMVILPETVTYNLAIVFLMFRELVNVLDNYIFHTKKYISVYKQ